MRKRKTIINKIFVNKEEENNSTKTEYKIG